MPITDIKEKWKKTPHTPGVYVMKNALGEIIYVGKAKDLKRRLSNYFAPSRSAKASPKTRALIAAIADFEIHLVRSDQESLILEQNLIKKWRPRYNIQLKDDKRYYLIRVRTGEDFPRFELARLRRHNGGRYWGPFPHSTALKETVEWLNRRFSLRTCPHTFPNQEHYKHCLNAQIRNCPAPCIGQISKDEYKKRFNAAIDVLEGKGRREILKELENDMQKAAENLDFEKAAKLRDMKENLTKTLEPARRFSLGTMLPSEVKPKEDLQELADLLELPKLPVVMECFDISNLSDNHIIASMVRFVNGTPETSSYRKYRMRTVMGQNDFASMAEVINRRYSRLLKEKSPLPDLVVVDGGKGQLSLALDELKKIGITESDMLVIGLAKKREEVFFPHSQTPITLSHETGALKLLQRLRDEAHRWANGYNELLVRKRVLESELDECPGMTRARKEALLSHFKTVAKVKKASIEEIAQVKGYSLRSAKNLVTWFGKTQ